MTCWDLFFCSKRKTIQTYWNVVFIILDSTFCRHKHCKMSCSLYFNKSKNWINILRYFLFTFAGILIYGEFNLLQFIQGSTQENLSAFVNSFTWKFRNSAHTAQRLLIFPWFERIYSKQQKIPSQQFWLQCTETHNAYFFVSCRI